MRGLRMTHGLGWTAAVAAMGLVGQTAGAATLINHYTFDGTLNDSAGTDHIAKGGGAAVFTTGMAGQAITFDGADDYLQIATQRFTDDFTMSMFIKPDALATSSTIYFLAANSASGARVPGFRWHFRNTGSLRLETANGGPTGPDASDPDADYALAQTGTGVVVGEEWQHVAMRVDRSGGLVDLFLDGVKLNLGANDNVVLDFPLINSGVWRLGASATGGGSNKYSGLMDDVRLYDGALTDQEIAALAAVPEPATAGLCLAAAGVLLATRRRGA